MVIKDLNIPKPIKTSYAGQGVIQYLLFYPRFKMLFINGIVNILFFDSDS
tara:strand:+ start:1125 stop:1274 length:150 start_codon:yes stop_codon:yes gene_type:complete